MHIVSCLFYKKNILTVLRELNNLFWMEFDFLDVLIEWLSQTNFSLVESSQTTINIAAVNDVINAWNICSGF